jgi:septum formation protein
MHIKFFESTILHTERGDVDSSRERSAAPIFCSLQRLVLASESPRRIELLRSLGLAFEVIPSGIEEGDDPEQDPSALVARRAQEKAQAVSALDPRSWVLSADTIVVLQEKIFGKPETTEEAVAMLQRLSGQGHHVFTALCLMRAAPPFMRVGTVKTEVRFKPLSDAEIRAYVKTGEPLDKAGAYGIQGMGAFLVTSINGSYTNVVGLPLCEVLAWLLEERIITPVPD